MTLERKFYIRKTHDGYSLEVYYNLGTDEVYSFTWPVRLQHTPAEIEQYISSHSLPGALAQSLRKWCYGGYSLNENGFFLGRENGSNLNYIDAYEMARQGEYPGLKPLDFFLISTRRRPVPAILKQPISEVVTYLDFCGANRHEEEATWKWVYEGHTLDENPNELDDMDYISWYRWDFWSEVRYGTHDYDDELPF